MEKVQRRLMWMILLTGWPDGSTLRRHSITASFLVFNYEIFENTLLAVCYILAISVYIFWLHIDCEYTALYPPQSDFPSTLEEIRTSALKRRHNLFSNEFMNSLGWMVVIPPQARYPIIIKACCICRSICCWVIEGGKECAVGIYNPDWGTIIGCFEAACIWCYRRVECGNCVGLKLAIGVWIREVLRSELDC